MSKHVTRMTIDDAEHFTDAEREEIIGSYPPHEREARIKGIPALGSGRVYPVADEAISVEAFPIPAHWAQIASIDFGWDHPTAAIKLAHDRDSDVAYVTAAYRRREATPLEHCAALKEWGLLPWAWPQDGLQRDKRSGQTLRHDYEVHGLAMLPDPACFPDGGNGVEAGVMMLLERMQTGRFKAFAHLSEWFAEFRLYHRKDGLIVKERDDLMDATRYGAMCLRFAEHMLAEEEPWQDWADGGRSTAAGY